ncbi:MAG: 4-hydroxythreonine-4-phosphate dehydrogenase PdxA, partial [Gammaproteobacteria bacterium]|nr:4-hydroxythreonine-4-phosphate dehydrogenase PdxA [Gammaproteobacteria bacterium]
MVVNKIAVSAGEPAGIGPDIILQTHLINPTLPIVVFADRELLAARAQQLNLRINFIEANAPEKMPGLRVAQVAVNAKVIPGQLELANADYVIRALKAAWQACLDNQYAALVTAPVHKGLLNDAGINFTGHTEWLAKAAGVSNAVMLFVQKNLKVALLTTHLALQDVPAAITATRLQTYIEIINRDFKTYFNIEPRILVCGLNPHAGENGHLGQEELTVITPVLDKLRAQNYKLTGPVSADTAFLPSSLKATDVVLAMYHDQALPVIKTLDFSNTVNMTLG